MTTIKSIAYAGTGYYKGNIGCFENDANATVPYGWVDASGVGCSATIVASYGTHNKVLKLADASAANIAQINYILLDGTYGTMEFYMANDDVTKNNILKIWHGASDIIVFFIGNSKFQYIDDTGTHDLGLAAVNDTWYKGRIDWECTAGGYQALAQYKWHAYVNDVHYGDYNFKSNQDHVDLMNFFTNAASTGYNGYWDAIGFPTLGNYTIGDNANTYTTMVYRHAKSRRGTHESHRDFSSFDITKMVFPEQT